MRPGVIVPKYPESWCNKEILVDPGVIRFWAPVGAQKILENQDSICKGKYILKW